MPHYQHGVVEVSTSFPLITPMSLSISVLPHSLLSALILLHALQDLLSPIPPTLIVFVVLLCYP